MNKYILIIFYLFSNITHSQDVIIKNLDINTKNSEFGTIYYGKNKVVFAGPNEKPTVLIKKNCEVNKQPYLDLYVGEINDSGQIVNKERMSKTISTKFHEAILCFTKDGKTVYFSANDNYKKLYNKKKNRSDYVQLYKALLDENDKWSNVQKLPFNSKDFSTGHPALSLDEKRLYFVSDRPESIGETDIFYVDIYNDHYGKVTNLGNTINTSEREMFPYISKEGVLYFSSFGHEGYGGLDIYASKIKDNNYSKPINLKSPINSRNDDFAFVIDSNSKGYFSSNRTGGKGSDDIYFFSINRNI